MAVAPSLLNSVIISSGSGKTMVVFFSTPIRSVFASSATARSGLGGQQRGRFHQLLGSRELSLRVDNLRPLFALCLGLLGHGALHLLVKVHLLDLDRDHFTPKGSVRWSMIDWMRRLSLSRWLSSSSNSTSPSTERNVVCANCEVW